MFLSLLNKKEMLKFLDLAIYMVDIDGEPTDVEKRLLNKMIAELDAIKDEYSFRLTYSDAGETFSDIESQDNKVAILIQGSLLAKVVTIEIEIYKNNSATSDWGQHLEFDMFK